MRVAAVLCFIHREFGNPALYLSQTKPRCLIEHQTGSIEQVPSLGGVQKNPTTLEKTPSEVSCQNANTKKTERVITVRVRIPATGEKCQKTFFEHILLRK